MKYVVLVSHGTFAPGLHSAVQMMTGPREDVLDTSLLPDMSADTFQENFRKLVRQALMVALGVMGVGALAIWYLIGRNALKRMDRMSDASQRIMAGDLSQRLPTSGSAAALRSR